MMILTSCKNRPVLEECTLPELNYQVDPYIGCGHYCEYCYVLNQAETDWRKEIRIHENLIHRLEKQLSGLSPQTIYMGWHTDPYQPCEHEAQQTRQVLELLAKYGFSASILTKSDLILRDTDVLQSMPAAAVSFSVAFTNDDVRRRFEANTRETGLRITALGKIKAAGIKTAALLCPVIPYITDTHALIDSLAGPADKIWIYGLSILNRSDRNWQNVKRILNDHFPELLAPIESVVISKTHTYWEDLRRELEQIKLHQKLNLHIHV